MQDYITIPLTQNRETIIDVIDADLSLLKWCASATHNNVYYALRNAGNGQTIRIHRVIMSRMIGRELETNEHVDHIDCNGLNNLRSNLRLCTPAENQHNQRKHANNTSGYKGVYFQKSRNKWIARIAINKKRIHLGDFTTPELAYSAYCQAANQYHEQFKRLE